MLVTSWNYALPTVLSHAAVTYKIEEYASAASDS